jgi:gamma-glutamyltranspeptidase/glutathione hydrolase
MLARHNAIDAVVAGVFAAAAAHAGVLLGPVQMLVAGAGVGPRAIDGRTSQPGKGTVRPRGFRAGEPIPPAARVAVPALPAALAAALATFGTVPLSRALAPAIEIANRIAPARAELFARLGQRGPTLTAGGIGDELVNAVGPLAGGLLTLEDLDEQRPDVVIVEPVKLGVRRAITVPWDGAAVRRPQAGSLDALHTHILAAIDLRGTLAIACYEVPEDGVEVGALQLLAPFAATPVLRGEPRVRPGLPCPAAAPIAVVEADGVYALAVGMPTLRGAEGVLGQWLWEGDPLDNAAPSMATGPGLVGIVKTETGVSSLRRTL